MTPQLQELARLKGIALEYADVWGQPHHCPPAVLEKLLGAMGVAAGEGADLAAVLAAQQAARWQRVLPAACVLAHGGGPPQGVRVQLPSRLGEVTLSWALVEEDELVHGGEVHVPGLDVVEHGVADQFAALLPLPEGLPLGYHRLSLRYQQEVLGQCLVIVAPAACHTPGVLAGAGRGWGAAVQLYGVRSQRNWGMGDFSDLAQLVDLWGRCGASLIGVNPLHAMFPHNPAHNSPYSPSSRLFVNTLYLDVQAIDDYDECDEARRLVESPAFQTRLKGLRGSEMVDYPGVAAAKGEVLALLYAHFRMQHLAANDARAQAFGAFVHERGEPLRRHALFEALQAGFHRADPSVWGWPVWPAGYREPESPLVARFAAEHADEVGFYQYLQWQADVQLARVNRLTASRGMGIGLYADLAVSIDRAGAEVWSNQSLYALGATVGAPPDEMNLKGQNWGLPPMVPERLADAAYAPFIDTLRACMRHAGALRIDHVMALMRLYWVGEGDEATEGAYVHYPFDDLLAILCLESQRHRCLVIGEDLGTVPPEVREKLSASGVLSYRLLFFERDGQGGFLAPAQHEPQALLAASTHDLPTLAGWWEGADIALRTELNLYARPEQHDQQLHERARDRSNLLQSLGREGLLPPGLSDDAPMSTALACAVHRYLARSPAKLALVQLEDVMGMREQVNLPGTTDQHPNWQRKLPLALEQWPADARFAEFSAALAAERGSTRAAQQAGTPRATYRVQLHRGFTFTHATALVPYLARLGISHLYCSPFLRARAGSLHGYDVVDHNAINPEIGARADLDALVATLHAYGMGMLIDLVPNHMGVLGGDNAWWLDVLENGQASAFADYFDIEWAGADPALRGKVLLPILGDQYGVVLERGELHLDFDAARGRFTLSYFEHRLPIDPGSYGALLRQAARAELAPLAEALEQLAPHDGADPEARARRQRDKTALKLALAGLVREQPALAEAIQAVVERMNGSPGRRASFDALDTLLDAQPYRLAHWRVAGDQINYRRFFDINELAALRMERAEVFEATHALVLQLAASGAVDGMRIDHPDGLADPAAYFERLQSRYAEMSGRSGERPLYVVIEKIVAPHEEVPRSWAVHGTTGYRFANVVNGLLIDGAAKMRLDRAWRAFAGDEAHSFEHLAWQGRHLVMDGPLAGELNVLATALRRLAREDRRTRDFTLNALREALAEVVASFPVYRSYIVSTPSAQDRRFIDWALGRARRSSRVADASLFDFLHRVLLGRPLPGAAVGLVDRYRAFARRLQQYTAPVAAKGIEDTALYRHHRLISVNDVGGDPDAFGFSVAAFHAVSRDRARHWPHTMLASSTHDAKRSEDVRARINVISEMPAAWRLTVRRWSRLNRSHRRTLAGQAAPTRNDEYLLYQTLVGCMPAGPLGDEALARFTQRIEQAMLKSARESKAVTSWINPDADYEAALAGFVQAVLAPRESNLFLRDLMDTLPLFAWHGALNGISLAVIKCLSPGVPDVYQGHEMIEFSLMDPDNRREVDYPAREAALASLVEVARALDRSRQLHALLAAAPDGRAKLWVTWRALQVRREHERLMREGDYLPLEASGRHARHVLAFARHDGTQWVLVVATRLYATLSLEPGAAPIGALWGDTAIELPPALQGVPLLDAISGRVGESAALAQLLADFPVAVLTPVPLPER